MKKYITVAALLIAGTAFANAESWTTTNANPLSYDRATAYGFVFNLNSDLLVTTPDDIDAEVLLDTIDIKWRTDTNGTTGLNVEATFVLTGTDNQILAVAKDPVTCTLGGTGTIDFGGVQISSSTAYRVWSASTEKTYTVGGTLETSDLVQVAPLFAKYSATSEALGLGIITNNRGEIWSPYAPVVTIHTSSIPEPATFGLFAGLGALCLVGTRRFRRSR